MERYFKVFEGHPREVLLKLDYYGAKLPGWAEDVVLVAIILALALVGLAYGWR